MFCKKCGAQIPDDANVCPQCGERQGQATVATAEKPKKKHGGLIVLGIIVLIIIIAIATGGKKGSSSAPSTSSATGNTVAGSPSAQTSKAPADQVYAIGQTAKVGDCEMTLTDVQRSAGEQYDKPQKDGYEFVIVNVTIKNDGSKNLSYNPYYFKMQNSQGQITDSTFTLVNQSTALNSGDLAAGGSVSGTVVFEQPKGDAGLILQYQDNIFANGTKLQFKCS